MWKGPDDDPGGGSKEPATDPSSGKAVSELKDQYDQSEILLAQLKEVLKKSEQTTVTPEKVELYANTLSRAKRNKLRKEHETGKSTSSHRTVDTPATEKINILRQQLEENKAKLAERGKNQKGIEEMVIQLKAQLDDSQHLISQTPLNLSLSETKVEYSKKSSSEELYNILLSKERHITELSAKVQKLEANVLDLQENVKEKDAVIDARTKAITLMTESLTKKGKSTLDALDETKEQMRKMQENFVQMEADMKARQMKLLDDLKQKNLEIAQAQEIINCLKKDNEELNRELDSKSNTIKQLETKIEQSKASGSTTEESKVIDEYIQQIDELKLQIKQLEESNQDLPQTQEISRGSPQKLSKKGKKRFRSPAVHDAALQEAKIAELQKSLESETNRNEELLQKISNLEEIVKELNSTISDLELKTTLQNTVSAEQDSEELARLKKQLDEQNKSMIKVKAQHKSKIKELNKKIDSFKKVSDANAKIVKLEAENSKLNQKIAELEEEKGNLQLKLVETDSKDNQEQIEELNKDLSEKLKEIQLKEQTITNLESEIQSSKTVIESLNDKLNSLSHLQQVQVTTEITSIQYEEQLDKIENEKKLLLQEKEDIIKQNEDLIDKLETLRKEKQDLVLKLENLEQENMELIEKLEKLSTEKVSSAESIEIVEGLTQQEKLEIEQFQKNLDIVSGNLKVSEENLMPTPDLNESVNQLTEETSELLQKIELFTIERREVMEKMEMLTNDNNHLSLKIKEIENNRDVLAETYEQLQNEKECLDNKIDELEKENSDLKIKLKSSKIEDDTPTEDIKSEDISNALSTLQKQYDELIKENENLQKELKQNVELVHEKDNLESELNTARQTITEMENKLQENLEEIKNYQLLIEDNRNELVSSADIITKLKNKLEITENELQVHKNDIAHLNSVIADLNNAVMNLENENKSNIESSSSVENQLSDLKSALDEHIQQAEEYEKELEHNSEIINTLNKELKTLNNKIIETEHLLDSKDDEINKLIKERDNKEMVINRLQESIKEKDEAFHKLKNELKEKYLNIQKQMEANSGSIEEIKVPLQNTIDDLTKKNKEQLDKMKKIAANLKKKNQAHQDLEGKYNELQKDLEEKNQKCEEFQKHIIELSSHLEKLKEEKTDISKKYKEENARLVEELQQFTKQKAELNTMISELTQTEDKMTGSLHHEMSLDSSNLSSSETQDLKLKIQKLKTIRQNQNKKIREYEERIAQLEDSAASAEHLKTELEKQCNELTGKLEETTNKLMEVSEGENVLLEKLTQLTDKCENAERKLLDLTQDKEKLLEHNKQLNEQNEKLKQKINVAQEKVHELSSCGQNILEKEQENDNLRKIVSSLDNEVKHLHSDLEHLTKEHKRDLESIDNDWQLQLNQWLEEKNELSMLIEKLNEELNDTIEKHVSLKDENSEQKLRLENSKRELEILKEDTQLSHNKVEEMKLELSSIQQENENLRLSLNDITNQMVTYQQQCRQLQTENTSLVNQLMNVSSNQNNEMAVLYNELNRQLEETTSEKQHLIVELQAANTQLIQTVTEFDSIKSKLKSSEGEIEVLKNKIGILKNELLKEAVVNTVDSVLEEATQTVSKINTLTEGTKISQEKTSQDEIQTFSWPQFNEAIVDQSAVAEPMSTRQLFMTPDNSDPFAFATSQPKTEAVAAFNIETNVQQTDITHNVEELLEKVKCLEIMLLNTEKEKKDLLDHCDQLSNEVLRLVYEKQQAESQQVFEPIVVPSDVVDTTTLQANLPSLLDLENQVQSDFDIQEAQRSDLHRLEFAPTKPCVGPCPQVIVEEELKADTAYVCYKKEPQTVAVDPFAEDDGWGFSPEEAKLEAQHVQNVESSQHNVIIERLQERIRVLELENQNNQEEIRQQQIKSGKLIKKLKELKQQNEKLTAKAKKSENDFFSLDDAIQEELKSQVEQLEKKIKELNIELNKEKTEKASILKRIDVLTAANERMIEMKEKQDIELLSWQRRNRELAEKLQQFEWGGDGFGMPEHKRELKYETTEKSTQDDAQQMQKRIKELDDAVKELTLDKEELQVLLDEQTALRTEAERAQKNVPQMNYSDLLSEKHELSEKYKLSLEEKKQLQDAYNQLQKESDSQRLSLRQIEDSSNKLSQLILEKDSLIQELNNKLHILEVEKSQFESQTGSSVDNEIIINLQQQVNNVLIEKEHVDRQLNLIQDELQYAQKEKQTISQELFDKNTQIENLQVQFENLKAENDSLHNVAQDSNIKDEYKIKLELLTQEKDSLARQIEEKEQQITSLTESLNTQIATMQIEVDKQMKAVQDLLEENKNLTENLSTRNFEYDQMSRQLIEKEAEVSAMIQQLTQEWELRVDQRGADVAESWKLHVEARESEFLQVQDVMRTEINELEEKCNALVNENNELRKNVDAEIKNEVDRIAALQKQINDRQHMINELTQSLQQKQEEIERLQGQITAHEAQVVELNELLKEKDDFIMKQATDEEAIQTEFNENQDIIKIILTRVQEKLQFTSISKDNLVNELETLLHQYSEYENETRNLQEKLSKSVTSDEIVKREEELKKMSIILEDQRGKLEELEMKCNALTDEVQKKNMELTALNANLLEVENANKLENEKTSMLERNIIEYEQQFNEFKIEIQEKTSSIEQLNSNLKEYYMLLSQKDEEINSLKLIIEEKDQTIISMNDNITMQNNTIINEYTQEINILKKRISESEIHYEELLSAKESDLETLKVQMNELAQTLQEREQFELTLQTTLAARDAEIDSLQQKINEQNVLLEDENKQLTELRQMIESQVLKIEELKQELYAKSNDYDSLIAEMDIRRNPPPTTSSDSPEETHPRKEIADDDLTEPVSRAEHDLALYMLHQRDVRCEELTVELTQLLSERDTLQLRLSNAIREREELRKRCQADVNVSEDEGADSTGSSSPKGAVPKTSKATAIVLGATGTEMATEATEHITDESEIQLANKLSELRSVGYHKDKSLLDDQELRRIQELSIMQQHRDVASKLPPEAAARLVDASYTLSRDVQSPSKVLLNWLWGRSTPKVNNI